MCKCGRTRLVQMISMTHDVTTANKGRKDRKTNMEIKKPYAVVQYIKFMKDTETEQISISLITQF